MYLLYILFSAFFYIVVCLYCCLFPVGDISAKKYKAKFVAHGFSQKEGVEYDEIFALVA